MPGAAGAGGCPSPAAAGGGAVAPPGMAGLPDIRPGAAVGSPMPRPMPSSIGFKIRPPFPCNDGGSAVLV